MKQYPASMEICSSKYMCQLLICESHYTLLPAIWSHCPTFQAKKHLFKLKAWHMYTSGERNCGTKSTKVGFGRTMIEAFSCCAVVKKAWLTIKFVALAICIRKVVQSVSQSENSAKQNFWKDFIALWWKGDWSDVHINVLYKVIK